ncbi:MAG: hypothetical protein IPK82_26215 [Polyangiaceae bacterium]|nr:hypothetical protein [Polyangiaceae bacterium]
MSFNPYAPPEVEFRETPPTPGMNAGPSSDFGIEEVLRQAWETVKVHWVALVFGPMIGGVIGGFPGQIVSGIGNASKDKDTMIGTTIAAVVIGMIIQTFFTAGAIQMQLTAARGGTPEVMQIFKGGPHYLRLLGTQLLVMLVCLGGCLLLVIPGIYLAFAFSMAPYYAVDAELGPIEAMRASWDATRDKRGQLFLYSLVGFGMVLLGLAACCVGVIPVQVTLSLGTGIIFTRLSGRMGSSGFMSVPSPFQQGGGSSGW